MKRRCLHILYILLILVSVLSPAFSSGNVSAAGGIVPPPPQKLPANELQWVGSNCNGLTTSQYQGQCSTVIGALANYDASCNNLGFQDQNHQDNWYVSLPNYTACYNTASSNLNTLSSNNCKVLNSSNTQGHDWQACQGAQGFLSKAIGCSGSMYDVNGNTYTRNQGKLNSCKSNLQAAGNVTQLEACKGKPVSSSECQKTASQRNTTTNSTANSNSTPGCDESGFVLSWIMCPIIGGLADLINSLYKDILYPILNIDSSQILDPNKGYYQVWSAFRIYGDIFLVLALLVIVFGESIGGGMIDAYAAKKVLPRLLLAAVLINLSIYIVVLGVDISNVVGQGIYSLIVSPFGQVKASGGFGLHIDLGGEALTAAAVTGGLLWAKIIAASPSIAGGALHFILTSILLPAALIMIAVLLTLLIRTALIYLLIFVSPVAFALYTIPNTEQYFRRWWNLFFRTLLIFPIVGAIFAIANVTSYTLSNTGGVFGELLGLAALFAPPIMIPFAFRMAGGLMAQIHQGINQRVAAPGLEALKKHRAEKRAKAFQRMAGGNFIEGNPKGLQGRLNRGLAVGSQLAQGNIEWSRQGLKTGVGVAKSLREQQEVLDLLKDPMHGDTFANDSADRAIRHAHENGIRLSDTAALTNYLRDEEGLSQEHSEQVADRIRRLNNTHTEEVILEAATIAEAGTKTGFAGGYDEMAEAINDVAGDDRAKAVRMMAQMRDRAAQAGRGDLAPSFGTSLDVLETLHKAQRANAGASRSEQVQLSLPNENGQMELQTYVDENGETKPVMVSQYDNNMSEVRELAREKINRSNLETKGPSSFWQGHGNQTKNMTVALRKSIISAESGLQRAIESTKPAVEAAEAEWQRAYEAGDEEAGKAAEIKIREARAPVEQAERTLAQKYAEVDAIFEAATYSGTPEATKFFADSVMNARVIKDGKEVPVSERRKDLYKNPAYTQTRRSYEAQAAIDQEERLRQGFQEMTEAQRRAEEARQREEG